MSLAQGPIQRPILTTMVFLVIITVGLISLSRLSVDLMPEITYPSISVITSYGNVGPQEMEELVTRPIEQSLAAVQGVEEITSSSSEGRSRVRVAFTWGTDLEAASNDVRDRIDRVLGALPEDIERPMIRKFDISAFPILMLTVASDLNPVDVRRIVEDQVAYRLERTPGVAAVDIGGGLNREIHINLQAAKLKALGLSPAEVLAALRRENLNMPAGLYERGNLEVLVRTQGEFRSLEEIRATPVATRQGAEIRIGDIATVEDSWEEERQFIRVNGRAAIRMAVNKQSGANTVAVAEAVRAEVERINRDIPQLTILPAIDTSEYIKRSINSVGNSALMGGLLAILMLFLFLRNVSSTLIIGTAIPISVIATFGLMYFGGFTLNIITFGALALGIGMIVDSAIVVLENIYRHREAGLGAKESSLIGASEVSGAIIASTLTTVVVFFPVLFIRGMSGIMFKQMAYVVSFALFCSLAVALTLVPMLTSRFLRYTPPEHRQGESRLHRIYAASEAAFQRIETNYGRLLDWALHHRRSVWLSALGLFVLSVVLVRFIGVELMPQADEGEVRVNLEMAAGTQPEVVNRTTLVVEETIRREVPELERLFAHSGGGGFRSAGGHTAEVRAVLVPKAQRKRSSEEIANALRRSLVGLPGVTVRTRAGQGLFLLSMGSGSGDNISVEVRGYDLATAQELAGLVEQVVKTVPGITDTRISRQEGSPEQTIRIDRDKAADLGLSVQAIGEVLETAVGGSYASYYREGGQEYRILVRLSEEDRQELAELLDLTVVNNRGQSVVLRNVVAAVPQEGPVSLERKDQERIITVTANFTGRDLGSIVRDIRAGLRSVPVPRDFSIQLGEEYEEQQKAFRELMFGLILALALIYMVMAGQFESFRDPFVVLFSIPMALIGVTLTMILSGTIFSMQAFIGCIMLAGIVVNNAILLVDYTNQLRRREGLPLMEAIRLSGARRLRPILMTTLTTVLALMPLSLGLGEGGEAQAPLARVVIGGLLSSSLITLVLIPIVYSVFEQKMAAGWSVVRKVFGARGTVVWGGVCLLGAALAAPGAQGVPGSGQEPPLVRAQAQARLLPPPADTLRISIDEAMLSALERNPDLLIQRRSPTRARAAVSAERAAFDPVLTAAATRDKSKTQRFLGSQPQPFELVSELTGYDAGLAIRLPTGTILSLDAFINESTSSIFTSQYSGNVGLTLTQSLLRGFGTAANLASLRRARLDLEISRSELRGFAELLVAAIRAAYWRLYLAAQEVDIQQESLDLAGRQREESLARIEVGRLPAVELAAVQAELARRESALIDAQSAYEQARLDFLYLVDPAGRVPVAAGEESGGAALRTGPAATAWSTFVIPVDAPTIAADTLNAVAIHEEVAVRYRPDLAQARLAYEQGRIEVAHTKNGLLPQLDFFITLGRTTYANTFREALPDIDSPFYNVNAGVSFEFPILNRGARADALRAKVSRDQLEQALVNMNRLVRRDIRSGYVEVMRTRRQIDATRATRELEQANLDAELEKFRVGRSTNLLVLQVQRDFILSRLEEIRAVVRHLTALDEFYVAEGTLLERQGIEVPEEL